MFVSYFNEDHSMGKLLKFPKPKKHLSNSKKNIHKNSTAVVIQLNIHYNAQILPNFTEFKKHVKLNNLAKSSMMLEKIFNLPTRESILCAKFFIDRYKIDENALHVLDEIEKNFLLSKPNKILWLLSTYFGLNGVSLVSVWQHLYSKSS